MYCGRQVCLQLYIPYYTDILIGVTWVKSGEGQSSFNNNIMFHYDIKTVFHGHQTYRYWNKLHTIIHALSIRVHRCTLTGWPARTPHQDRDVGFSYEHNETTKMKFNN